MAESSATTLLFFSSSMLVLLLMSGHVYTEPIQDKQVLLAFISRVAHASRVQWNASDSACNWFGVGCDDNLSSVYYLRLPAVGLVGRIPDNTLGRLSQLRVLSLRSNGLWGPIPSDFTNLTLLRALYLQDNQLSGAFPSSFTKLPWLARVDLSSNNFTGSIPFAVNNMTHLTGLFLEKNGFFGNLPNINPTNLANFNVSNNRLNGSIPAALTRFPSSAFAGNIELCGGPLPPCSFFFQSPQPSPSGEFLPPPPSLLNGSKRRLSTGAIIGIAIGAAMAVLVLLFILLLCLRRRTETKQQPTTITKSPSTVVEEMGTSSSKEDIAATSAAQAERDMNKLVFVEGGVYSFDLEDLLRASAEVLGKGSLGTSYKAVLEAGTTVVVKRLKNVVVTRAEFEELMHALGNIKHENLVPLRAYYYSKDEKLLLYDYMPAGSLSASLHGSSGSGRTTLDWDRRMRVALSAARGLAYLHLSGNVVHGDVKSSNILLQQDNHDACLSDFGLNPLFGGSTTSSSHRVTGYRVPEVLETHKVTFKSDVYSFGVLLLELLTGKSPNQASLGEDGIDLPRWVQSVVREEWTAEVFDVELMRYHNIEEEMVQLLQIAMPCVALVPDQRPAMQEVVKMIKEINRAETDDGLKQSDDPSKVSDSHTPPQESRTSPYCFRP